MRDGSTVVSDDVIGVANDAACLDAVIVTGVAEAGFKVVPDGTAFVIIPLDGWTRRGVATATAATIDDDVDECHAGADTTSIAGTCLPFD